MSTTTSHRRHDLSFVRNEDERLLTGVSAGLGAALGVDVWIVRIGFVVLSLGAGLGVLAYLLAYAASTAPVAGSSIPRREVTARHTVGFMCTCIGLLGLVQASGWGLPSGVMVPVVLIAAGAVIAWTRLGETDRARLARDPSSVLNFGRFALLRVGTGLVILATGIAMFLVNSQAVSSASSVIIAVAATVAGLFLMLGPWLARLARQTGEERRRRIRSEERAEVSAHLHDSVLHTLALIQRSDVSADVVSLARAQERELRAWMQGRNPHDEATFGSALEAIVSRVEEQHQIRVENVLVGDAPLDDRGRALVGAIQEALVNSGRHSGATTVSLYVEVDDDIVAFVRDEGIGFDPSKVDADRQGIAESIEGRMQRAGGKAIIRSEPGGGTEIELRLTRASR